MSVGALVSDPDPFAARIAVQASGLLRQFNVAGVLSAADVHVARRLGALAGESSEPVLLAAALAVRGPRLGHVHVDLAAIRGTAAIDTEDPVDLDQLPWPEPEPWLEAVAASPLVARETADPGPPPAERGTPPTEPGTPPVRPLRLRGAWLYLDRYWAEEIAVAAALLHRSGPGTQAPDSAVLEASLERMFPGEADGRQSDAARAAVLQRFAVVAGGPGTGKTTTVARIVALLAEQAQAAGRPLPLVALAAPTGKAAARLQEAVREETGQLEVSPEVRELLLELQATTLHRLLGWRPGSNSRFRHDRGRRLAHDVVIVDETSMVSLSLMARLIEALRDDARLVLVGDPGQLASIEAGAVLGDIVGPAGGDKTAGGGGTASGGRTASGTSGFGQGIVVLDRVHRFGGDIAALATAIRRGEADAVLARLTRRWRRELDRDRRRAGGRARTSARRGTDLRARCDGRGARRSRGGRARGARRIPDPLRAPARALWGDELDRADGVLAAG